MNTTPDKKMTQLTDNIFAVEIPEDAKNTSILPDGTLRYFNGHRWVDIELPGHYTLLFISFDNFFKQEGRSIDTFLRYKGLDPSKNYAIIKKHNQ